MSFVILKHLNLQYLEIYCIRLLLLHSEPLGYMFLYIYGITLGSWDWLTEIIKIARKIATSFSIEHIVEEKKHFFLIRLERNS